MPTEHRAPNPLTPGELGEARSSPRIRGLWGEASFSVLLPQTSRAGYQWDSVYDSLESMRPEERLSLCFLGLKTVRGAELEREQPRVGKQKISGRLISLSHWGAESCTLSIGLKGDLFPILPGRREETAGTLAPLGGVSCFYLGGEGQVFLGVTRLGRVSCWVSAPLACLKSWEETTQRPSVAFHSYTALHSNTYHLATSLAFDS